MITLENITTEDDIQFLMNQRLKFRLRFMFGIDYKGIERKREVAEQEESTFPHYNTFVGSFLKLINHEIVQRYYVQR